MSTSLAEQLQRLALPQASNVQRDKKRPSLLFDPKEAAGLSREQVFQIGLDGFEELLSKNSQFSVFENSLFHVTSKDFERSVQSTEANEKLNRTIKKFLQLLSPYFLLSCSHKCLEWLVHRYYINEYNKDDLMMLILPYHETNIFVRALQMIKIKDNDAKWVWLKSLQRPGIHLPKTALYNHAANDVAFIQFISDNLLSTLKLHEELSSTTVLFNFYCTTFTGALEFSKNINEAQISQILPSIIKGLKSDIPDFCASAYLITSSLLLKTKVSDKLLDKLVERMSTIKVDSLRSEGLVALLVLYQSQDQYTEMPDAAVKNLVEKTWIPNLLQKLIQEGYLIEPFIVPFFRGLVRMAMEEVAVDKCRQFVNNLLTSLRLEDYMVKALIRSVLGSLEQGITYPEETKTWVNNLINQIEKTTPTAFDAEISLILKKATSKAAAKKQKVFKNLIQNANMQNRYNLFETLNHPVPEMRKSAIKSLIRQYTELKNREKEFITNSIADRLNDDDCQVIKETLDLSHKILSDVINESELKDILLKIISKGLESEDFMLIQAALKQLCKMGIGKDIIVFLNVLPFLLPVSEKAVKTAKIIINSPYLENSIFLNCIQNELVNANLHSDIFNVVFDTLSKPNNMISSETLLKDIKDVANFTTMEKYLVMILLTANMPEDNTFDVSLQILSIILEFVKQSDTKLVENESKELNLVLSACKHKLPIQGFLSCIAKLICKTQKLNVPLGILDLFKENDGTSFLILLLDFLLKGAFNDKSSVVYSACIKIYFDHFSEGLGEKIKFLLNILIAENKYITPVLRLRTVRIVASVIRDNKDVTENMINEFIPYYLVALCNEHKEIRLSVLNTFEILLHNLKNLTDIRFVLKGLISSRGEINMDQTQVPQLFNNSFKTLKNIENNTLINDLFTILDSECPLYLKSGIMQILSCFNKIEIYTKFSQLGLKVLTENENENKLNSQLSKITSICLLQFNEDFAKSINITSDLWKFTELALRSDKIDDEFENPSVLLMSKVSRELFDVFNPDVQKSILDVIIEIGTKSVNPHVLSTASRVFKHIDLDASLILDQLTQMLEVQSPKLSVTKRKRRTSVIPTLDILDTIEWKKGITVLEFIQDKKKVRNIEILLPLLFNLLKKCLDFDEQANVEYPKQLVLTAILHYCDKLTELNIPTEVLNMELVVQCIRASQNPQTHHHALLLLAHVASFVPDQVLHHITAIFTFMGSSVLRHDDAYSFQIITKIVETIIPILILDGSQKNIIIVLRVFVDIILDVPEHRRMSLYKILLKQIGPKENLNLFLLLMFESHVSHPQVEKQSVSNLKFDNTPKRLDIASDLCREFSPEVVLSSCIQLIEHLKKISQNKDDNTIDSIFNRKTHTAKQFRHYKYTLITFTSNLLTSKEFVIQVAKLPDDESLKLEDLYKNIIISMLTYIQSTTKVVEQHVNTPQFQYWKIMLHHAYDVLDGINALLTSEMFLLVIKGLLTHNLYTVKKRALELMNSKIQLEPEFFKDCNENELYAMIPPVINIIKGVEKDNLDSDEEILIQTALLSLKLFVRTLAPSDPKKFTQVLQFVTDIIKLNKVDVNILASAILCLSELCTNLRAHSIPYLDKFMSVLIKILKVQKGEEYPTLLTLSTVTALHKIIDTLSLFLSPYLEKLLCELSNLAATWSAKREDPKVVQFFTKLTSIQQKIGTNIPPRILIPYIDSSYKILISKEKYKSAQSLMDILAESLSNITVTEIKGNISELTTLFLNALQFRADISQNECANEVESHVIKALVRLILKLSESTFRPFYYKLYDWAIRTETKNERLITFYAASSEIANSLKGLFVLFAGHFLNNAATTLNECNLIKSETLYFTDEYKNVKLLENILKTLNYVFIYDNQKFINKERFDVLMQPIVDQLENTLGDGFETRVRDIVIPCIVNFAVAVADDALWKQLNYQVLLKMRHSSSIIRLLALECLRDVAKKLGEDFLPLLPETIPFLAELLEDEEESVEKACQKTVQELEKVLGEPLQKYF